ncbi:MAG: CotH kinase family protein [Verrucomicrobiota bacterium]
MSGSTFLPSFIFAAIAGLIAGATAAQAGVEEVVIHEVMADNRLGLRDEDGAASDWLELHNPTTAPISLVGAALTDNAADLSKWPVPGVVLPAQGYLVIFASGKDRRDPAGMLHTNFSLAKGGEFLALTWQGQVVNGFVPSFPPQVEDVSYGYRSSGSTELVFMSQPTPGAPNNPISAMPGAVEISPPGGIFVESLTVTLSTGSSGAEIHYTLDGTVPTVASPVYAGPITVPSTTRLRAVAVERANGLMGVVTGASWVRLAPDLAGYTSPLPLMVIENFNAGPVPAKGLSNQQVAAQAAVWMLQERVGGAASMAGVPQLTGDIGIRGRGYLSSTWSKKPYAVECRSADGAASGAAPLGLPANDDWVLYYPDPGALRDSTLLANTFIYELSRRLGRYAPRFRFVEVFLNENGGDLTLADRQGVYVLMEKISRGTERLDFTALSADGSSGGALLSINRPDAIPETGFPADNGVTTPQFFRTAGPDRIFQTTANVLTLAGDDLPGTSSAVLNFEQPGGYRILSAQRTALETWFRQFEGALYHPVDWRDPVLGWRKWLVEEDWAEGYLLSNFTRHSDAFLLSVYPWLGNDRKLRLGPIWDVTPGGYTDQGSPDSALYYRSSQLWFPRLLADTDFKQTYLDRWTRWRRSGFSDAAMEAIIDGQAAEITSAKAVLQGIPNEAEWQSRLTAMKAWVKGRAAFFDSSFVPLPVLVPAGGIVSAGSSVAILSSAPEWWVTTDGSDPRLAGGAVSPTAVAVSDLVISQDVRITARSRNGADWSGPVSAVFAVGAVPATSANLTVSEIHYHPAEPSGAELVAGFSNGEDFEFIELHNPGAQTVSLHDVRLVLDPERYQPAWEGAEADRWSLPPGGRLILVRSRAAFGQRYGMAPSPDGVIQGVLSNSGGNLLLEKTDGSLLGQISYGTKGLWPSPADGAGYSLTLREGGVAGSPAGWRSSVARHGTPGGTDAVSYTGSTDAAWQTYALGVGSSLSWTGTGPGRSLTLLVPPGADRAGYFVEQSADLTGWQAAGWWGPVESRTGAGDYLLSWVPPVAAPLRFLRVRATALP